MEHQAQETPFKTKRKATEDCMTSMMWLPPEDEEDPAEFGSEDEFLDELLSKDRTMCDRCNAWGNTIKLNTFIPGFRTLDLAHFFCRPCGFRTVKIDMGKVAQKQACRWVMHVPAAKIGEEDRDNKSPSHKERLSVQVIASEHATIEIGECSLEIPYGSHYGKFLSLEALLTEVADNLEESQQGGSANGGAILVVIDQLRACKAGSIPFVLTIDDPTGNSYVALSATAAASASCPDEAAPAELSETERAELALQRDRFSLQYEQYERSDALNERLTNADILL